ncbi:MAG: SpoIIE family protein phosphatase [Bacteroidia bacterium]|nr:SpoIIE family protein phosphatase [Bacteroidia bacterium]
MATSALVDKFIYFKDKESSENYLKGKFFVYSTFLFFLLCFSAIPYYALVNPKEINEHPELFVFNLIGLVAVFSFFWIYKKWGKRILLVNIMTFFGWAGNFGTFETTGGIFSADNIWGIIISAWVFLVADKISGIFWFVIIGITLSVFYYCDLHGVRDFRAMTAPLDSSYYFFNYILAVVFMCLIVYLYETSKEQFLEQIKSAKAELELRNKDVTDSINYAKRIQSAVLPHEETIYRTIPLSFIYYKPKDIVSGDFFWFHEINKEEYILVCADCTGHGVPGAFMTVIGSSLLNQTVIDNKITEPSKILIELDKQINFTLKQQKDYDISVQDGMDLSLVKVNKLKKEFIITGAKRPVAFIRDKQLQDLKGSKFSLGGMRTGEKVFEEIKITYQEGDMLYFYTDGYTDQFGGEKGKKFSSKRLKEHFLSIHRLSVAEQKQNLDTTMNNWMKTLEQVDDMLVIGIKL